GDGVHQDIDRAEAFADGIHQALDRVVAVFLIALVITGLLVHVVHRVEAGVAGDDLFDLQHAGVEGKDARVGVGLAFEDVLNDPDEPRVAGKDKVRAGRVQGLRDIPGETDVIAHARNQGHFSAQIQGNHAFLGNARASI